MTTKTTRKASSKKAERKATRNAERLRTAAIAEIGKRLADDGTPKPDPKPAKPPKPAKAAKPKRVSALDAAATVLAEAKGPMRAKDLVGQMAAKGLWTSPGGKTPEATLYAAILREIATKKGEARFTKVERGLFAAAGH